MKHELMVLDIETSGFDRYLDDLRVVGMYFPDTDEYIMLEHNDQNFPIIQQLINDTYAIVTFNGDEFDIPFMEWNKYKFDYKVKIDLYRIVKEKREKMIKFSGFKSYSLNNIIKELGIANVGKLEIDYKIFQKEKWTKEEWDYIQLYLKKDLELAYMLWRWLDNHFQSFKELLNPRMNQRYWYVNTSAGAYGYAAICNMLGIEVKYNDVEYKGTFEGGFVSIPKRESVVGNVYCLDYKSAYIHAFIQMNLFSSKEGPLPCDCCTGKELWAGNELYPVKGRYCSKRSGTIESKAREIYLKRLSLPKDHPLNIPYKILLNIFYGISSKPSFHWVYSRYTASDCTLFVRESIKYARKKFTEAGYDVLYSDTDSVYLVDVFGDEAKLLKVKDCFIDDMKRNVPFPADTFDMAIEDRISYIQFFYDNKRRLKKKLYLYVTEKGKVKVKGLQVLKKNCSRLSLKIFEELKPQIVSRLSCKFDDAVIWQMIEKYIKEDLSIVATSYAVKDEKVYSNKTSIQYSIARDYGKGEHLMVKNKRIGVGKNVKYCTLDEAKSLNIKDLDLNVIYKELSSFAVDGMKRYIGGMHDQTTLASFNICI